MKKLPDEKISLMVNGKKVMKPVIEISVDPGTDTTPADKLGLRWEVVETKAKSMKI